MNKIKTKTKRGFRKPGYLTRHLSIHPDNNYGIDIFLKMIKKLDYKISFFSKIEDHTTFYIAKNKKVNLRVT